MKKFFYFIIVIILLTSCEAEKAAETIKIPVQQEPQDKEVTLIAAGDNLIHSYIYKMAQKNGIEGDFNFLPSYENVSDIIKEADIAFLNQETVLGGKELGLSGYPLFNSPAELGRDMITLGFDVFNTASNHSLDKGETGLKNSFEFWNKNPDVLAVGVYESAEEMEKIHIIERAGIKFAVLAYTYGTNGIFLNKSSLYKVSYIDEEIILAQTKQAKELADIVLVSMHWGTEDKSEVEDDQRDLAIKIANAGADAIIGHHPHVLRPVEWITKDDGSKIICAYSLGNFISTQKVAKNLMGGILSLKFKIYEYDNRVETMYKEFIPTISNYNLDRSSVKITPFTEMTEEDFKKHGAYLEDKNVNIKYYTDFLTKLLTTPDSAIAYY